MWIFRKRKQEVKPASVFDLMDQTVQFMLKLKALGGFGYVLFGAGLFIVLATIVMIKVLAEIVESLLPLSIVLLLSGFVFIIVDRIMAYRMAEIKLRMIVSVTQAAVTRSIATNERIDTAVVKMIVREVLPEIWSMWLPEERESPKKAKHDIA